jgi:hypothetical protein
MAKKIHYFNRINKYLAALFSGTQNKLSRCTTLQTKLGKQQIKLLKFINRWIFLTNQIYIGTQYLLFGIFADILEISMLFLIRAELAVVDSPVLNFVTEQRFLTQYNASGMGDLIFSIFIAVLDSVILFLFYIKSVVISSVILEIGRSTYKILLANMGPIR